ncbi:MAG: phosphoadenosine phosphosulfate reductase domain-containing protein, partial [Candidatus Baldrarchaeia archaeon]
EIVKVHPIAYWKEEEVWRYIKENGIPVHPAYSYTNRIGCLPCTGYRDWMILLARVNSRLLRKILKDRSESKRLGEDLSWFF